MTMKKLLIVFWLWLSTRSTMAFCLNEIYASPAGGDPEWLEVYNELDTPESFAGWQIAEAYKGEVGNYETVTSEELVIPAHGFLQIIPSKLTLNNGGDTIYLFDPQGRLIEGLTYPKLTTTQAYARIPDGGPVWDKQAPTPGLSNVGEAGAGSSLALDAEASAGAGLSWQTATVSAQTAIAGLSVNSVSVTSLGADAAATNATNTTTTGGSTNQSTSTTTNTASPTPTPSPQVIVSGSDQSWAEGISFAVPRIHYWWPAVSTPVPAQVLGAHTLVPAATLSAQTAQSTSQHQLLLLILALFGIILGLGSLVLYLWLEYRYAQTGVNDEQTITF